jgi:type II secretory ATPase GspE/PulE/Tfp pilus assembly ATPase PilB-like protein
MAETVINMPGYDRKIASILVKNGKITAEKSEELQLNAKKKKLYLEKILIDEKIMTEDDYLATLAEEIQISPIRLENYVISKDMKEIIDEEMAVHYGVLPISKIGDSLTVALCNPFDIIALDDIKIFTHTSELRPMLTTIRQLTKGIEEVYKSAETQINDNVDDVLAEIGLDAAEIDKQLMEEETEEEGHENDSTIVKLVNTIILNAYNLGASDIHIEPYLETDTIVRYRIDGTCDEKMRIPKSYKSALISRIKIMCDLDISERRLPQDGKIKFKKFGPKDIELRVATIPTVGA